MVDFFPQYPMMVADCTPSTCLTCIPSLPASHACIPCLHPILTCIPYLHPILTFIASLLDHLQPNPTCSRPACVQRQADYKAQLPSPRLTVQARGPVVEAVVEELAPIVHSEDFGKAHPQDWC